METIAQIKAGLYLVHKDEILAKRVEKKKAKNAAWRKANQERIKATKAAWYKANAERDKATRAAWRKANAEYKKAYEVAYRKANAQFYKAYYAAYRKHKRKTDPAFKIQNNLRKRFKGIMKTIMNSDSNRFSGLIGCSANQLKAHIESQFKRWMTWENYGTHWHIDHIIPCAAFDHSDPKQRKQCWHWTNLRPLEAKENIAKRDKIIEPQMNLLLCANY